MQDHFNFTADSIHYLNEKDKLLLVKFLRSLADYIEKEGELPDKLIDTLTNKKVNTRIKANDPIGIFDQMSRNGIEGLKKKLEELSVGELKSIIYYHKFIDSKAIYKLDKNNLVHLIMDRAKERSIRGDVFSKD